MKDFMLIVIVYVEKVQKNLPLIARKTSVSKNEDMRKSFINFKCLENMIYYVYMPEDGFIQLFRNRPLNWPFGLTLKKIKVIIISLILVL